MSIRHIRAIALMAIANLPLFAPCAAMAGAQDQPTVLWERIVGITPVAGFVGQNIEGIGPVGFPWTVEHGRAMVNLRNQRFHFYIQGLAIGAMPTLLSPLGTTGVVTAVRGTFVCTGGGPVFDTEAVALSSGGDAFLKGRLPDALDDCDPGNWVFLLRVAEVLPGAPDITGSWLAYGAAQRIGSLKP